MAIRDTILTLKNKEGTLTNNKVCNFAYDDTAFADDTATGANGVVNYNYNNHNNIPVKDNAVIKVNPTITSKGFRSQVSTLPRMLLNHIFGRVSYNLNKTVDTFNATLQAFYEAIGQANGLATLDNTGRLPYSQLPLSAVEYKGAWNAETNTPALSSGSGTFGDEYIVSVQGTRNLGEGSVTYRVGDRVIYNGSVWQRIPSSSVRSVNTKTPDANGNVTVNAEDMTTPDVYGRDRRNALKAWEEGTGYNPPYVLKIVAYANGLFVAGGTSRLAYSEDGKHWEQATVTTPFNAVRCLRFCYGNDIWLVGTTNGIFYSYDGKSWTQTTITTEVTGICYANGLFVAISLTKSYWSNNGRDWTECYCSDTYSTNFGAQYGDVYYANGLWVAGASYLYWSEDGKNWTQVTATGTYFSVPYFANGLWVTAGSTHFYWSNDGKTWVQGSECTSTQAGFSYANGLFVAYTGHSLYWSEDGKTWTNALTENYSRFVKVYYAQEKWIACYDENAYSFYSTDGKNWTQDVRRRNLIDIVYIEGMWVGTAQYISWSVGSITNNVKAILDWLIYAVDNMLD